MKCLLKDDGLQYLFFITVLLGGNLLLHSFGRVMLVNSQSTKECVKLDIASKKKKKKHAHTVKKRESVCFTFQAMPHEKIAVS